MQLIPFVIYENLNGFDEHYFILKIPEWQRTFKGLYVE